MNVAELIERLKQFDGALPVFVTTSVNGYGVVWDRSVADDPEPEIVTGMLVRRNAGYGATRSEWHERAVVFDANDYGAEYDTNIGAPDAR